MTRCPRCTSKLVADEARCAVCQLDLAWVRTEVARLQREPDERPDNLVHFPPRPRLTRQAHAAGGLSLSLSVDADAIARAVLRRLDSQE